MGSTARPLRSRASFARCAMLAIVVGAVLQVQDAHAAAEVLQPSAFVAVAAGVVRVEATRQTGGLSIGSGVTVAPSIVVTNCHVVRDAATLNISGGGAVWAVTGQWADGIHDVCFLHAPAWSGRPAALGERGSLRLGQPVAAIGFTGGAGRTCGSGSVRALHALDGGRVIESDTAFTSGAVAAGSDATGTLVALTRLRAGRQLLLAAGGLIRDRCRATATGQRSGAADALPILAAPNTLPYFMRAARFIPRSVERAGRADPALARGRAARRRAAVRSRRRDAEARSPRGRGCRVHRGRRARARRSHRMVWPRAGLRGSGERGRVGARRIEVGRPRSEPRGEASRSGRAAGPP